MTTSSASSSACYQSRRSGRYADVPPSPRLPVSPSLLLIGLLALMCNCRTSTRKTIAVIPKATSHVFWQSVQAGALAAGKDLNVEVLWNGPTMETDLSRQIQIVDSM